ncbi:helix-turn-helix domain-containing protein [Listeria booriae]|uniref:Helix-turn-helix transcriptional regulator n=1 Tax=Listeria booriae TaxID=1552123 RepID=A0A841ZTM5_9LIST|nr:helix-turn-helix transcriptional regulator [Listeria booriae]MBC1565081.1 helix-turn-helix transcriptional regulator [Listeria booriae]
MKTIADTILYLRTNLNLKQRDFKQISQSTIANIENQNRIPRVDTFVEIVHQLETSLNEFMYIQNNYQNPEREQLFKDFRNQKHSIYLEKGKKLIQRLDDYIHRNPNDALIKNIRTIIEIYEIINASSTYEIESPESLQIYDKIEEYKVWTFEHIYIMSKIFYIYPEERALSHIIRIKNELEKYKDYADVLETKIAFLLNSSGYLIEKGYLDQAQSLLLEAYRLSHKSDKLVLASYARYSLAQIYFLKGENQRSDELLDKVYNTLTYGNKKRLVDNMKFTWENFVLRIKEEQVAKI